MTQGKIELVPKRELVESIEKLANEIEELKVSVIRLNQITAILTDRVNALESFSIKLKRLEDG